MIEKIKENKYIKMIHELLQNKRTRAGVILVLWIVFFTFVFAIFDIRGNQSQTPNINAYDDWKTTTNYEYDMTIEMNQDFYKIRGVRHNQNEMFHVQEKNYYVENNLLYLFQNDIKVLQEDTKILEIDILKLRPDFIANLISNGVLDYTTNYESGIIKKGYSISTAKFIELYQNLIIADESFVIVEVVEQNNQIIEVNLDLKNFQNYNGQMIHTYKVNIQYSNIGNVSEFAFE